MYMLPVMNQHTKEWIIDNQDGTYSKLSNDEYNELRKNNDSFKFKTRYDTIKI